MSLEEKMEKMKIKIIILVIHNRHTSHNKNTKLTYKTQRDSNNVYSHCGKFNYDATIPSEYGCTSA